MLSEPRLWNIVSRLDEWLDNGVSAAYKDQPLAQDWARIAKVQEEAGEAIAAFIGFTGQNPRKGFTHLQGDVLQELADVALTAILAIQHFTKDAEWTQAILEIKLLNLKNRLTQ